MARARMKIKRSVSCVTSWADFGSTATFESAARAFSRIALPARIATAPVFAYASEWMGSSLKISSADWFWQLVRRSEEHTSELQSPCNLVCRLLLENKNAACHLLLHRDMLQLRPMTSITGTFYPS